jgi:hypothetical protein
MENQNITGAVYRFNCHQRVDWSRGIRNRGMQDGRKVVLECICSFVIWIFVPTGSTITWAEGTCAVILRKD